VRLEDEAVVLRPLEAGDAQALVAAIGSDPDLDRWTQIPFPYTEEHARAFISTTEELAFAILDRGSGELLGGIGARDLDPGIVEVGYWVKAGARRRGVATRALVLVTRFAFDRLRAGRVQLKAESGNLGSQRVAEKAGFAREGVLRSYLEFKGRRRDAVMFSLLPGDWDGGE
jgi:RimJ/RimL family protein N-acetyltransferase